MFHDAADFFEYFNRISSCCCPLKVLICILVMLRSIFVDFIYLVFVFDGHLSNYDNDPVGNLSLVGKDIQSCPREGEGCISCINCITKKHYPCNVYPLKVDRFIHFSYF